VKQKLLVVLVMLWGASPALAQIQNIVLRNSFSPIGAGARGLGMGGAFIAIADDGTAASFNPAGLAQLRRTEIALVGFTDTLDSTFTVTKNGSTTPTTTTTSTTHSRPDFAGLSIPFTVGEHTLTIEGAYQRSVDLFGQGSATVQLAGVTLSEIDPDLKGTGDIIADVRPVQSGAFQTISLSSGYELTSHVLVGATVNYWLADWTAHGTNDVRVFRTVKKETQDIPINNTTFSQAQSLRGINLNLGFLARYSHLSIGAVAHLPFVGEYSLTERDQSHSFDVDAQGVSTPRPATTPAFNVNSRLHWPLYLGTGVAVRPLRGLTFTGDLAGSHWSQATIDDVPAGALLTPVEVNAMGQRQDSFTDRNFFDLQPASETTTQNTLQWRLGGEYLIVTPKVVLPLRGGWVHDRSPVTDPGADHGRPIKGWTAGTGLNFAHVVLDVAYERLTSEGEVSFRLKSGQPIHSSSPAETIRDNRVVASVLIRFGENDAIRRSLDSVFVGPKSSDH
jgi:long-subunit fatty acid transport protein